MAMNDIMIKISGKQYTGDGTDEDRMEFVTEGKMSKRNGSFYYIYEESEFSGIPGCKTMLKLKGDSFRMKRMGKGAGYDTEMVFEKGKRYQDKYRTPFGVLDIEILTNRFESTIGEDGKGRVEIDYIIMLGDKEEHRNHLSIDIL